MWVAQIGTLETFAAGSRSIHTLKKGYPLGSLDIASSRAGGLEFRTRFKFLVSSSSE